MVAVGFMAAISLPLPFQSGSLSRPFLGSTTGERVFILLEIGSKKVDVAIATWHNKGVDGTRGHGEGNGNMTTEMTYTIDFTGVPNRFMATTIVYAAVRAGYVTEAEAWQQWANFDGARLEASRTPAARAAQAANRALNARAKAGRAREALIAAQQAEAERVRTERAQALAYNAMVALEEATDRAERAAIAVANRARYEAERVAREEAAMTAETRRTARLERDQDTADEVGRIVQGGFNFGPFGGAE